VFFSFPLSTFFFPTCPSDPNEIPTSLGADKMVRVTGYILIQPLGCNLYPNYVSPRVTHKLIFLIGSRVLGLPSTQSNGHESLLLRGGREGGRGNRWENVKLTMGKSASFFSTTAQLPDQDVSGDDPNTSWCCPDTNFASNYTWPKVCVTGPRFQI